MKQDETKEVKIYGYRHIAALARERSIEQVGSANPASGLYFAWPESCPACRATKINKTFHFTDNGRLLGRTCGRCGVDFYVRGQ